jgi:hypothetical protein
MADITQSVNNVQIAPIGDLTVKLTEYESVAPRFSGEEKVNDNQAANPSPSGIVNDPPCHIRAVSTFVVDRSVLIKCTPASAAQRRHVFAAMLDGSFREATSTNIFWRMTTLLR